MTTTATEQPPGTAAPDAHAEDRAHGRERHRGERHEGDTSSTLHRVLWGLSGGALALVGLRSRGIGGALLTIAGGSIVVGQLMGGGITRRMIARAGGRRASDIRVQRAFLITRPPLEVYRAWRDLERLPRIMRHIDEVREVTAGRSHWRARVLAGAAVVEWDAEIVEDREGELLSWRSLPGAPISASGAVRFLPAGASDGIGECTMLQVEMAYAPVVGGVVARATSKALNRAVAEEIKEDLRRFKTELEAGETPTTEGQPTGAKRRKHIVNWIDRAGGKP